MIKKHIKTIQTPEEIDKSKKSEIKKKYYLYYVRSVKLAMILSVEYNCKVLMRKNPLAITTFC